MRFKVFALFVAIQIVSFGLWQATQPERAAAFLAPAQAGTHADQTAHPAALALTLPNLHFSERNQVKNEQTDAGINDGEIMSVLAKLPKWHVDTLRSIILDYDPAAGRGLGGSHMMILRAVNVDVKEFDAVMVHEMGHNVDLMVLNETNKDKESPFKDGANPIYETDPSLAFYRVSWNDVGHMKKAASNLDFVSGYAMTDPFEDFAETYAFYVLHNASFKALATSNPALAAKYTFMKDVAFAGKEFATGTSTVKPNLRPWDVTVLGYDLDKFLQG